MTEAVCSASVRPLPGEIPPAGESLSWKSSHLAGRGGGGGAGLRGEPCVPASGANGMKTTHTPSSIRDNSTGHTTEGLYVQIVTLWACRGILDFMYEFKPSFHFFCLIQVLKQKSFLYMQDLNAADFSLKKLIGIAQDFVLLFLILQKQSSHGN